MIENDQLFPDDIRAEGQKFLVDHEIPHEIQVFPGVPHGLSFLSYGHCYGFLAKYRFRIRCRWGVSRP